MKTVEVLVVWLVCEVPAELLEVEDCAMVCVTPVEIAVGESVVEELGSELVEVGTVDSLPEDVVLEVLGLLVGMVAIVVGFLDRVGEVLVVAELLVAAVLCVDVKMVLAVLSITGVVKVVLTLLLGTVLCTLVDAVV